MTNLKSNTRSGGGDLRTARKAQFQRVLVKELLAGEQASLELNIVF